MHPCPRTTFAGGLTQTAFTVKSLQLASLAATFGFRDADYQKQSMGTAEAVDQYIDSFMASPVHCGHRALVYYRASGRIFMPVLL